MADLQQQIIITPDLLKAKAREMRDRGYRLVQIGATALPELVELNYSFDRDGQLLNYRLQVPAETARVPSITDIYWCAFIYENEISDLFKVQVDGMAVDFKGKFYKTAIPHAFSKPAVSTPAAKPSPPASIVAAAAFPAPSAPSA